MLKRFALAVATVTAMLFLTSCLGGSSSPATPPGSQQNPARTVKQQASCPPCLYVPNLGYAGVPSTVTVYPVGTTGNTAPSQYIHGSRTQLKSPEAVAVDSSRNIYVAQYGNSVTIYAAGVTGNVAPTAVISGHKTGLDRPFGIALDPVNGDIYVANEDDSSITFYAAGSSGDVNPLGTISGANTGLDYPLSVALDASGNIYVSNLYYPSGSGGSITVYPAGSVGNAAPTQTIGGSDTGLNVPLQLAVDSNLNIYVANNPGSSRQEPSVAVYAAGANGNVAPTETIEGTKTKMSADGVALDASGNIYVSDDHNRRGKEESSITFYAAGSSGDVKPLGTLEGNKTKLLYPGGIAIR